jgi:hypothetical protein
VPDRGEDEMSTPMYRFHKAFEYTPEILFAAMLCLWQTISLQALQRLYDCNIVIPLGGRNFRMRERQFMHSMIALATGPGNLGQFKFSGFGSLVSFEAGTKQFNLSQEMAYAFLLDRDKQFVFIENCRGGPIIGGSDNLYFDQRRMMHADFDYASLFDRDTPSNMAVLGSYNEAVEGPAELSVDVRGFWDRADFASLLHTSVDFDRNREKPMYSGQFEFNELHRFWQHNRNMREDDRAPVEKLSFAQKCMRKDVNYHCHQTSVRYYDGSVSTSVHPWGEHDTGVRDLVTSGRNVTENETSAAFQLRKKARYNQ